MQLKKGKRKNHEDKKIQQILKLKILGKNLLKKRQKMQA